MGQLIEACFSGNYDKQTLKKMITGEGGYVAYFGTNDAHQIQIRAQNNDSKASSIQQAMGYQVAKYIGSMSVVLKGKINAILITGGLANNKDLIAYISERISFIAPVLIYPGEDEMKALALNALNVQHNEVNVKVYQ